MIVPVIVPVVAVIVSALTSVSASASSSSYVHAALGRERSRARLLAAPGNRAFAMAGMSPPLVGIASASVLMLLMHHPMVVFLIHRPVLLDLLPAMMFLMNRPVLLDLLFLMIRSVLLDLLPAMLLIPALGTTILVVPSARSTDPISLWGSRERC